jgi:hypothetical protein
MTGTIFDGQQKRCKMCNHRWNLHYRVRKYNDRVVCDGESESCPCTQNYYRVDELSK